MSYYTVFNESADICGGSPAIDPIIVLTKWYSKLQKIKKIFFFREKTAQVSEVT